MVTLHAEKNKENKTCASKSTVNFILSPSASTYVGKAEFTRSVIYCLPPTTKCENNDILARLVLKSYIYKTLLSGEVCLHFFPEKL